MSQENSLAPKAKPKTHPKGRPPCKRLAGRLTYAGSQFWDSLIAREMTHRWIHSPAMGTRLAPPGSKHHTRETVPVLVNSLQFVHWVFPRNLKTGNNFNFVGSQKQKQIFLRFDIVHRYHFYLLGNYRHHFNFINTTLDRNLTIWVFLWVVQFRMLFSVPWISSREISDKKSRHLILAILYRCTSCRSFG